MKRSEMLAKIRQELLYQIPREDFENQILDAVEKLGMLPPCVESVGITGDIDECTRNHVSECRWENE